MDTILTLADAWARQFLTTLQDAATIAWTWLAAQPIWVIAALVLGAKAIIVTGIVLARRRHRRVQRVAEARERAATVRTGRATPKAARASRAAEATPRRTPFTPAASASQARELVVHGVPAIEISRRTGLSRDAVSSCSARRSGGTGKDVRVRQVFPPTRPGRPVPTRLAWVHKALHNNAFKDLRVSGDGRHMGCQEVQPTCRGGSR